MDVLLNFLPLKSGGGLQIGLDFLEQVHRCASPHRWFLVATAGTPLADVRESQSLQISRVVPSDWPARLWFEAIGCRQVLRRHDPHVIYTQFGVHWPGASHAVNVVGCAYSNLCYPEVDFWRGMSAAEKRLRELRDHLRRRRIQQADAVIFETEDLAERGILHLGLARERVHVVRTCASSLVHQEARHPETAQQCATLPQGFRVLLLSVYRRNKNFEMLPRVAQELRRRAAADDTVFVVTLPRGSPQWRRLQAQAESAGVADKLFNFGPVPQQGCAELYRACHAVILPSQLESFSNTIAEAWTMGRPLLISDLPWAHGLCGDAAAYFPHDSQSAAADRLLELRADPDMGVRLVAAGRRQLALFPTPGQRFSRYVSILEHHARR